MERQGRIWCTLLILLSGCITLENTSDQTVMPVTIQVSGAEMSTRAADPDESLLTELTLMIFDENGFLESKKVYSRSELMDKNEVAHNVTLVKGKKYDIYACANLGMDIKAESIEELMKLRYFLAYPDEYRDGIAMAGKEEGVFINDSSSVISLKLQRLMSKICLRIDRGGLSDDVSMNVVSVRIGNCPRSASVFESNSVKEGSECFPVGFSRSGNECNILNTNTIEGVSGAISLYMLENMQGEFGSSSISDDSDKVFDELDYRRNTCSYIEMGIDYTSSGFTTTSRPLTYRFYLGDSRNNLDVERNCRYDITVIPEDDGLSDEGWRIDKSGLEPNDASTFFDMSPSGYIQAAVGEKLHIRCSFRPETAPFDIGMEELETDRERGLYDYETDEDGHGVVLTFRSPGMGIIYMSAGDPVNETGMLVIEITDIKNNIS